MQKYWPASGYNASAEHTLTAPSSPGTMNIRCEVVDNAGNGYAGGWQTIQVNAPPSYSLSVNNGSGGGSYTAGTGVSLGANSPPSGHRFSYWSHDSGPGSLSNSGSSSASFSMGSGNASVTAHFEDIPEPPSIEISGPTVRTVGVQGTWPFSTSDNDGDLRRWRLSLLPNTAQWTNISGGSASDALTYTFGSAGNYTFRVHAEDWQGHVVSRDHTVQVNPAPPVISSATSANATVASSFSYSITASNSPTSYAASGLPGGLSISTSTGLISGTPSAAGNFSVGISATNSGGTGSSTLALSIKANQSTLTISPETQSVALGDAITFSVSGGSGTGAFQWGGEASGTATPPRTVQFNTAGTRTLSVYRQGDGTYHQSNTATATITVSAPPAPVITSAASATGTTAATFSFGITATNSPTSFSATGLPAGLSVNSATGVISGTPTQTGTFNVALGATNPGGTGTATLSLSISALDTTPPSAPTTSAEQVADTSFVFKWNAATDNVAVTGYEVRRNGSSSTTSGLNHTFTGLTANTTYTVEVRARDAAGNWSAWSGLNVTTKFAGGAGTTAGQTIWTDYDGDGLLDQILHGNSPDFNYFITSWYTENTAVTIQINNHWNWVDLLFGGSVYDDFSWVWFWNTEAYWTNYATSYTLTYFFYALQNEPVEIFLDRSGSPTLNLGSWEPSVNISGGFGQEGYYQYSIDFHPGDLPNTRFFMLKRGKPVGSAILSHLGTVLGSTSSLGTSRGLGGLVNVTLPSTGSVLISAKDILNRVLKNGPQIVWDVWDAVNNIKIGNSTLGDTLDMGVNGAGQFQVGLKLDDSNIVWFNLNVQAAPQIQFVRDLQNDYVINSSDPAITFATIGHWGADRSDGGVSGYGPQEFSGPLYDDTPTNAIDQDPARFYVRVFDPRRNTDPNSPQTINGLKIGTLTSSAQTDDDLTEIRLVETGNNTGVFVSKSQLLTGEDFGIEADDDYQFTNGFPSEPFVADDTLDDRTHRAVVDGSVKAEYTFDGQTTAAVLPVSNRASAAVDGIKLLYVVVNHFNEPWQDSGYDHDGNLSTALVGAGNDAFDFTDANGNGKHDSGEPCEPFVDISGGVPGNWVKQFGISGSRGPIWAESEIDKQMSGLRAGLAQAGIRVFEASRHLREPRGKLFSQEGDVEDYGTLIGMFDTGPDNFQLEVPARISRDHALIQGNFRSPQQFTADETDDLIDIYFTAPFLEEYLGLALNPNWVAGVNQPPSMGMPITMGSQTFVGLLASRMNTQCTLAHEIFHHLTNADDQPSQPYHILFPKNGSLQNAGAEPTSRRRIQDATANEARSVRPAGNLTGVGNRLLRSP